MPISRLEHGTSPLGGVEVPDGQNMEISPLGEEEVPAGRSAGWYYAIFLVLALVGLLV